MVPDASHCLPIWATTRHAWIRHALSTRTTGVHSPRSTAPRRVVGLLAQGMRFPSSLSRSLASVRARLGAADAGLSEAGMSTAEYAVGTVAAVAFAVVLYRIVRSDAVSSALSSIVQSALHALG